MTLCFVLDVHVIQMNIFVGVGFIVALNRTFDRTLDIRHTSAMGLRVYAGSFMF